MQNSPASPRCERVAGRRVGDADLDVRVGPTDRRGLVLERVAAQRLGRHRRRLGHAVADGHVDHVHAVDALLHHLDRARRAGHHAGAQARQVELRETLMTELGDEHRRHAVEGGAALLLDRVEHGQRVERVVRDHHRRALRGATEVAHDHAEAVVERHGDAEAIGAREALQRGDEATVVEDVAVRERRPLGVAGGARRVLDVDRIVGGQAGAAGVEVGDRGRPAGRRVRPTRRPRGTRSTAAPGTRHEPRRGWRGSRTS